MLKGKCFAHKFLFAIPVRLKKKDVYFEEKGDNKLFALQC